MKTLREKFKRYEQTQTNNCVVVYNRFFVDGSTMNISHEKMVLLWGAYENVLNDAKEYQFEEWVTKTVRENGGYER